MIRLDDGPWCFLYSFVLLQSVCFFSLKIFVLKWIFVLACCFRQTSKRHLLLWLTAGEDELDDESPSIKNQRQLAFSPSTNAIFIKTLDATTVSILFLVSNLPLLLQLDSCSGLLRMSFWRFFSCSATLLSKISTPLETCVGQKLILIQCVSLVIHLFCPLCTYSSSFACRNIRGHSPASANCNAPAGSRTRGTSTGGLHVAAALQALLFMRYLWICLFYFLF